MSTRILVTVAVVAVALDLACTSFALNCYTITSTDSWRSGTPRFYESRPLGNLPTLYYPWMIIGTLGIYQLGKKLAPPLAYHLSLAFASLPILAALWNLIMILA